MVAPLCWCATAFGSQDSANLKPTASAVNENSAAATPNKCLPNNEGFFRARLAGALTADLSWDDETLECTGATRPDGGARMRFSHPYQDGNKTSKDKGNDNKAANVDSQPLIFVLGIPKLREGIDATALTVNITVIRQGSGRFFGTMGDNKCLIDTLQQKPLAGIPKRNRSYRVIGRGFCSQPARELTGEGLLHITRFDFSGRIDYNEEDSAPDPTVANNSQDNKQ
jgi:hypothetical protein